MPSITLLNILNVLTFLLQSVYGLSEKGMSDSNMSTSFLELLISDFANSLEDKELNTKSWPTAFISLGLKYMKATI